MRLPTGLFAVSFGSLVTWAATALGASESIDPQDFRVENKIFTGSEKEPQVCSTTIFCDGVVYDYLEEPAEVTVFDKAHGRFVLLDLTRQIKTELTTAEVLRFTERLKRWTQTQSDPVLRFLGDPQFEEQFDEASGELSFTSPWVTYQALTIGAESKEICGQYRESSDWYGRLNTLLNPGARPPFARMIVSEALEQRGLFPREIRLTLKRQEGLLARRFTSRSEHLLVRQLVESDRRRVAQTGQFMAMYTTVDFSEYQRRFAD